MVKNGPKMRFSSVLKKINYYCLLIMPWNIKWYWSVSSCINPISGKFFFWRYWWKGSQWIILQDSLMRFGHRKTSMSYVQISDFEKSATKSFKLLPKRFWWIEDIFLYWLWVNIIWVLAERTFPFKNGHFCPLWKIEDSLNASIIILTIFVI